MNSIIYGNTAHSAAGGDQVYLEDKFSDPDFIYCDLEGGREGMKGTGSGNQYHGDMTGTIDADPLFTAPLLGDFSLSWTSFPLVDTTRSPCIDRGHPDPLYQDPDGTRCDIGKKYFDQTPETPELYPAANVTANSFEASWSQCCGTLGYYLDVSLDEEFMNIVYDSIEIQGDTNYLVEGLDNETLYYFRVYSYNTALSSDYSNIQSVSTLGVSIEEKYISSEITVFPNPFNASTMLFYTLDQPEDVQFTVYNVQSQVVFIMREKQDKGEHKLLWNAEGLPAGMYYYSVQAGDIMGSGKMIVLD
jgi:hypothetical protein